MHPAAGELVVDRTLPARRPRPGPASWQPDVVPLVGALGPGVARVVLVLAFSHDREEDLLGHFAAAGGLSDARTIPTTRRKRPHERSSGGADELRFAHEARGAPERPSPRRTLPRPGSAGRTPCPGSAPERRWVECPPRMKVAVCVKEVPESTAPRRIDPLPRCGSTARARGTLNPWALSAVRERCGFA